MGEGARANNIIPRERFPLMKIALSIEHFSKHRGGAESYAVELARTLISEGWEVHLFGHEWDLDPPEAIFHEIPRLPKWIPPSIRILHFAWRHRILVSKEHFDVIVGFGNTITMNVYQSHGGVHSLSTIRKIQGISHPLLRSMKRLAVLLSPKHYARAWIESAPFRIHPQPLIVAISDMVRQDMARAYRVSPCSIRLVYNGIDVKHFGAPDASLCEKLRHHLGFSKDHVLFLFMAYDFAKKGVANLLQAAALLQNRVGRDRFGVVVVGGEPSSALVRLVKRLNLVDSVVFPGRTREPELFYGACDVFVLPTFYDACSLVVFEAMAAGLPAITTVWNGASGIITPGLDGVVLSDPRDSNALALAMAYFIDRNILRAASQAARQTAARYTIQVNHRKMLAIFQEAAQSSRQQSCGEKRPP